MDMLKRFWQEEEGLAVVEILLIMAVLIVIALLFRKTIVKWVEDMLATLLPAPSTANPTVYEPSPS